ARGLGAPARMTPRGSPSPLLLDLEDLALVGEHAVHGDVHVAALLDCDARGRDQLARSDLRPLPVRPDADQRADRRLRAFGRSEAALGELRDVEAAVGAERDPGDSGEAAEPDGGLLAGNDPPDP